MSYGIVAHTLLFNREEYVLHRMYGATIVAHSLGTVAGSQLFSDACRKFQTLVLHLSRPMHSSSRSTRMPGCKRLAYTLACWSFLTKNPLGRRAWASGLGSSPGRGHFLWVSPLYSQAQGPDLPPRSRFLPEQTFTAAPYANHG